MAPRAPKPAGTAGRGRGGGFKRPSAADKAVVKASAKPRTQARPERQAAVKPGKHVTLAPSASGRKPALQRGPSESRSPTTKRLTDKVSDAEPPVQSFDLPYYSAGDAPRDYTAHTNEVTTGKALFGRIYDSKGYFIGQALFAVNGTKPHRAGMVVDCDYLCASCPDDKLDKNITQQVAASGTQLWGNPSLSFWLQGGKGNSRFVVYYLSDPV